MSHFNVFGFTHLAVYGGDFVSSSKIAWSHMTRAVGTARAYDLLVGRVCMLVSIFNSVAVGGVCYAMLGRRFSVAFAGFLISDVVHSVMFSCVSGSALAILVCVAECPEAFRSKHPDLAARLHAAMNSMQGAGCCDDAQRDPPSPQSGGAEPMNAVSPFSATMATGARTPQEKEVNYHSR